MISALRAGTFNQVIKADLVWMCVSCYARTRSCPAKIPLTSGLLTRTKEELLLNRNVPVELQNALQNTQRYGNPLGEVFAALLKMAEKDIGALLVIQDDRLVGIFSERDYARKIILTGKSSLNTPVSDVMTCDVLTISPEYSVKDCMALMTEHHIRHLPVVEDGILTGIISIGDVVKAVITGQERLIISLENYIAGVDYGKV